MFTFHARKRLVLAMVAACAFPGQVYCGSEEPPWASGKRAPKIELEKLLNAPEGAQVSWESLRGKVVVLEFWATYCGPCVAVIPAMNKLEAKFEHEPVVFIHITGEDEATVRKFLKDNPIRGWIGIDRQKQTCKNFGIEGLPEIVVVGKEGRILGWTAPLKLVNEPKMLRDILAKGSSAQLWTTKGRSEGLLEGIPRDTVEGEGMGNLCDIVIRRSTADSAASEAWGGGDSRGSWSFDRPLLEHISWFCGFSSGRVVTELALPEGHYDIIALNSKAEMEAIEDIVCRLIAVTFDLSMTRETRVMDAYVLRLPEGRKPVLTRSLGGVYIDKDTGSHAPNKEVLERMKKGETFFFTMIPLTMLADSLSSTLGRPVVDELGSLHEEYDEFYTICFPCDTSDPANVIKALEEHVGFTLTPQKREVEVLVVRKAQDEGSAAPGPNSR